MGEGAGCCRPALQIEAEKRALEAENGRLAAQKALIEASKAAYEAQLGLGAGAGALGVCLALLELPGDVR